MWAFSRASRSLHYSCFLSNNSLMRVLWDPSLHGLGLVYIGCEDLVTYHSDFRITVFTTIPSLVVWFSLVAIIWVGHHPLYLLASLIHFQSSLFILIIPYLFLSYIDTCLWFISLFISITYRIEDLTTSFSLIVHHWHFHCLLSSWLAHEITLHITSYTWGYWVWSLDTWA